MLGWHPSYECRRGGSRIGSRPSPRLSPVVASRLLTVISGALAVLAAGCTSQAHPHAAPARPARPARHAAPRPSATAPGGVTRRPGAITLAFAGAVNFARR